jgi:predicted TIM-barrel fold metal-dependent hydrolase
MFRLRGICIDGIAELHGPEKWNREDRMPDRRQFLKSVVGASPAFFSYCGCGLIAARAQAAQGGTAAKHQPVIVGGRKIKTVDVHCHVRMPEVTSLIKGTPLEAAGAPVAEVADSGGSALGPERLEKMDEMGIDVQAVSVVAFWYSADRALATRLIDLQNHRLAEMCAARPDRFVGIGTVALQFPELAAKQLEDGMKLGLKGAAIVGNVGGEELSSPKYDPFWAKAEELQAAIFMHPQGSAISTATGIAKRVQGSGALPNVIGNPLETTIFLSHMIFEGAFDRFPNLKLLCAHGGGYLPSYADRMDHGCTVFPSQCKGGIKKKPTEYLKQIYVDSLVFTPEALRHLVAVMGPGRVMLGTDYPFPWSVTPVDHLFSTPGLTDADRTAILGGNACQWLGIPTS